MQVGDYKELEPYKGPVIYIVHGPLEMELSDSEKESEPSAIGQWEAKAPV